MYKYYSRGIIMISGINVFTRNINDITKILKL